MNSFYLSSVIALTLTTFLAFFVLFKGKYTKINQVFFFFLLTLSAGIFGDIFYFTPLVDYFSAKSILRFVYIITPFAASTLLHFIFLFTNKKPFKHFILVLYLISFVLSLFNLLLPSFFFSSVKVLSPLGVQTTVNTGFYLFILYIILAVVVSFGLVIYCLNNSYGRLKEQMKY